MMILTSHFDQYERHEDFGNSCHVTFAISNTLLQPGAVSHGIWQRQPRRCPVLKQLPLTPRARALPHEHTITHRCPLNEHNAARVSQTEWYMYCTPLHVAIDTAVPHTLQRHAQALQHYRKPTMPRI